MICIFEGPQHVFQFVNSPYQALVGPRPLVGLPIAEAMPELAGQPIFGLLDQVYQTGEAFRASEMLVQLDHANAGPQELDKRYYNFIYQARYNLAGATDGILVFAYEVTAQVEARQQQQQLNEALETRVAARTQELQAALRDAEEQREQLRQGQERLQQILGQVPAAIATITGPEHRYSFLNDTFRALAGHRARLGLSTAEVFPELAGQGFIALLDQVYATGQPFVGTEVPIQLPSWTASRSWKRTSNCRWPSSAPSSSLCSPPRCTRPTCSAPINCPWPASSPSPSPPRKWLRCWPTTSPGVPPVTKCKRPETP